MCQCRQTRFLIPTFPSTDNLPELDGSDCRRRQHGREEEVVPGRHDNDIELVGVNHLGIGGQFNRSKGRDTTMIRDFKSTAVMRIEFRYGQREVLDIFRGAAEVAGRFTLG